MQNTMQIGRTVLLAALLVGIGMTAVPGVEAAPRDECNGLIEDDGCSYWDGNSWQRCRLWAANTCLRGGLANTM